MSVLMCVSMNDCKRVLAYKCAAASVSVTKYTLMSMYVVALRKVNVSLCMSDWVYLTDCLFPLVRSQLQQHTRSHVHTQARRGASARGCWGWCGPVSPWSSSPLTLPTWRPSSCWTGHRPPSLESTTPGWAQTGGGRAVVGVGVGVRGEVIEMVRKRGTSPTTTENLTTQSKSFCYTIIIPSLSS